MSSPSDDAHAPGDWQQAIALLEELLGLPDGERDAALAARRPDPRIATLVARLLQADRRGSILDAPLTPGVAGPTPTPQLAGRRLGRWLLVDLLGEGGMSVVYRARSLQPPRGQLAALKLLSMAAAGRSGRTRFERETAILTRLRHPGIAPILDAGVAPDGTPWFAMGLVDGVDIVRWCREQAPGLDACVDRFIEVCDVVAHAHRHLVVHRDIKPSNVMVDGAGRVVLLDFGIARLLEDGGSEATGSATLAFTPRFAAPEQVAGQAVTTATDVFGLGCLLHLMLLDCAPQYPGDDNRRECIEPAMLAGRCGSRGLARALRGDLGAVLRKSLAADPSHRHPGAAELAADLRAWRHGQPVSARRDGRLYRLRRFAGRNPAASALGLALVLSLIGGLVASLWQAEAARQQAQRAERELARAETVREYVVRIFAAANPSDGAQATAADLLRAGGELVTDTLAVEQPVLAADLLGLIGEARRQASDYAQARVDLERGLAILDQAGEAAPGVRRVLHYELGENARTGGRHAEAIAHYEEALSLTRATGAPAALQLEMALWLATARSAAGGAEQPLDALQDILAGIRSAGLEGGALHLRTLDTLSTATHLAGGDQFPLQAERLAVAARVYADRPGWLAFAYADAIPAHRARRLFERAQELSDASVALAGSTYEGPHVIAAIVYCNAAGLAWQRGRNRDAEALVSRAIEMDRVLERRHIHAFSCLLHQTQVLAVDGRYEAAVESLAAAGRMLDALALADDTGWREQACEVRAWMALENARLHDAAQAIDRCAPAGEGHVRWNLLRAERAYHQGDLAQARSLLAPWKAAHPLPDDAPDRLRGWQLDWALAAAADPAAGEARRRALREAVERIPEPWDRREALLACLGDPGAEAGCLHPPG